jgi:hypothetical protein
MIDDNSSDSAFRIPSLIVAGAILFISSLAFTLLYPLAGLYAEVIPKGFETKPVWSFIERGVIVLDKPVFVAVMAALHIVYFIALLVALRHARRSAGEANDNERVSKFVLLIGVASAVVLLWSYPLFSQDVFDYTFHTHEWVGYGASPFTHTPSQFSSDLLYSYVAWTHIPSPYGPLWIMLTAPLSAIAGADLFANLVLFKALDVLCYAGCAFLLYLVISKVQPRYSVAGTLLFAWNPLVLIEFGSSGHNDVVMLSFAMLAAWLVVNSRFLLGLLALTVSLLVKVVTIFLVPLFGVLVWRELSRKNVADQNRKALAVMRVGKRLSLTPGFQVLAYLLLCAIFSVLCYLPLWEGSESLAFLRRGEIIGSPVGNIMTSLIASTGLGYDMAATLWKVLASGSLAGLILRQSWVVWTGSMHTASDLPILRWLNKGIERGVGGNNTLQEGNNSSAAITGSDRTIETGVERLFRTSLSVMLFYAVITSQYYQPWYLSWSLVWAGMLLRLRYNIQVWTVLIMCAVAIIGYVYL